MKKEKGRALEEIEAEGPDKSISPMPLGTSRCVGGLTPTSPAAAPGGYKDQSGGRARCSEWGAGNVCPSASVLCPSSQNSRTWLWNSTHRVLILAVPE